MDSKKPLEGVITGCTSVSKHPVNRKVTTFYVKSDEGETRELKIHDKHEVLLPGRRITVEYNPSSGNWAEHYTLFDEDGNKIYHI